MTHHIRDHPYPHSSPNASPGEPADQHATHAHEAQFDFRLRLVNLLAYLYLLHYHGAANGQWHDATHSKWRREVTLYRHHLLARIAHEPVLSTHLHDERWFRAAWEAGLVQASNILNHMLTHLPEQCPWRVEQVLSLEFWPAGEVTRLR